MTLPNICPKDGSPQCKGPACHLYIVDWRSGDKQCIIGYSSTHKRNISSRSVEDTYAERTRLRTGRDIGHTVVAHPIRGVEHLEKTDVSSGPKASLGMKKPDILTEKVVVNNKDTMVFESMVIRGDAPVEGKKRKSIDDIMNLALPDDYEEEFWK
jgi:hypothetical protein